MFKNAARNRDRTNIRTAVMAAVVSLVAAFLLSACQTSTQPDTALSPKLESGTTITDGTLTVGINGADSPYGGTNSSNETIGLDVDVAAALSDELGMKLQIVDVNTDGRGALEAGQVDLVLDATKTGAGQSDAVSYTSAYINDGASLFCLSANAPESIGAVKVGSKEKVLAQANTACAYTVQEALGAKSLQATSTLQEAFDALEAGEQTYLVADAVIGDYFARNYDDVQRVGFLSSTSVTPVYGMTLASNAELASSVDQAFETMSQNGVLRVVAAKWLGSQGKDLLPGAVDLSKLPETVLGSQ